MNSPTGDISNFRYPAEWEPQKTIWLTWPQNQKEWGNRLENIRKFYIELIVTILPFQSVSLIISPNDFETLKDSHRFDGFPNQCLNFDFENDDIWIRDYGPVFLEDSNKKQKILDFGFNSYGGKFPPWEKDNNIPQKLAQHFDIELCQIPIILEGGSIELNGSKLLITTEQCLLDKKRNPGLSKFDYEVHFKTLGIEQSIWLKNGLLNDHTDGHIDNFVRFIDSETIVICQTKNTHNSQYSILTDAKNQLINWSKSHQNSLIIHEIPLPENIEYDGECLPASYANFIFLNGALLVPLFKHKHDSEVLGIFKDLLPDLEVIGIDCNLLIQEGGGLHCISKQQPIFSNS